MVRWLCVRCACNVCFGVVRSDCAPASPVIGWLVCRVGLPGALCVVVTLPVVYVL